MKEGTMSQDVECPYCGKWNEVCHDDGFGYDEGVAHEMECEHCEKSFVFHTSIHFYYSAGKADCLNGAPHDFREWRKLYEHEGKIYQNRTCRGCGKEERQAIQKTNTHPTPTI